MKAFGEWMEIVGRPAPATFDTFMKAREIASNDYINGDAAPLLDMATNQDPSTFFPPNGERVAGADEVAKSHEQGAKGFAQGSSGRFEVLASGASGRLAYWTGIQHGHVRLKGKDGSVPMQLRTTEIFRFEQRDWKLAHRHADFIEKKG
jgi:ketosteroid isomerase-like protein